MAMTSRRPAWFWDVGDADCWTFPLPGSLTPATLAAVTDRTGAGQHASRVRATGRGGRSRHVLQRVIHSLQAEGFHPVMAVELEFYLLDRERDSDGRPLPALQMNGQRPRATQVYGVYELEQLQPFLDDLYAACEAQGLPARTAISEYAPGQVEITLQHRFDALQAIDEGVRYKRLVKGVANRHGLQACFMAKAVRRSIRQRPAPARQPGRRRWQQSVRQRGPGRDPCRCARPSVE